MKKNDLRTGDIVVMRYNGELGVILLETNIILFQNNGREDLDDYDENMIYLYDDDAIMEVYRNADFREIDDEEDTPIYQSDVNWIRPSKEEREAFRAEMNAKHEEEMRKFLERLEERNENHINIIAQAIYGNRTLMKIERNRFDNFILGELNSNMYPDANIEKIIVPSPKCKDIVIVYGKKEEEEELQNVSKWYQEDGSITKPLAIIPELDLKIYSRCLVCRIDENGIFQSLQEDDAQYFIDYLAS